MQYIHCQHFRSEFVRQSQATIMKKVTMTQFIFVLLSGGVGLFFINAPLWTLPLFMLIGYIGGYNHHGEFVYKRVIAYMQVWIRLAIGRPKVIDVQAAWDKIKVQSTSQQRAHLYATVTLIDSQ